MHYNNMHIYYMHINYMHYSWHFIYDRKLFAVNVNCSSPSNFALNLYLAAVRKFWSRGVVMRLRCKSNPVSLDNSNSNFDKQVWKWKAARKWEQAIRKLIFEHWKKGPKTDIFEMMEESEACSEIIYREQQDANKGN